MNFSEILSKPIEPLALRNVVIRAFSEGYVSNQFAKANLLAILLVDDNQTNRKLGQKVHERARYANTSAKGGRAAVTDCESALLQLVLMDSEMPESGGVDACRIVREGSGPRSLHVVVPMANAIVGDREKYLPWGFDGNRSKPLNVTELRVRLQRAGRSRRRPS